MAPVSFSSAADQSTCCLSYAGMKSREMDSFIGCQYIIGAWCHPMQSPEIFLQKWVQGLQTVLEWVNWWELCTTFSLNAFLLTKKTIRICYGQYIGYMIHLCISIHVSSCFLCCCWPLFSEPIFHSNNQINFKMQSVNTVSWINFSYLHTIGKYQLPLLFIYEHFSSKGPKDMGKTWFRM